MKMDEKTYYLQRNSSYLLKDYWNFNEISRKEVTYDNIKSHKKPSLKKIHFWKNHRGSNGSAQPFSG